MSSKSYDRGDGLITAIIGSAPLHYLDAKGGWQDIDTKIIPYSPHYSFACETNIQKSYFAEDEVKIIVPGGYFIWLPKQMGWEKDLSFSPIAQYHSTKKSLAVDSNVIHYVSTYQNIDEEYRVLPGETKHLIIIKQLPATIPEGATYLIFEGEIKKSIGSTFYVGGVEQLNSFRTDEEIIVKNREDSIIYRLPAPIVYEKMNVNKQARCIYEVKAFGDKTLFRIKVPASFLKDSGRLYPVIVDPTVIIYPNADTEIRDDYPNNNYGTLWDVSIGKWVEAGYPTSKHRGLFKFDLSPIPSDVIISSATFNLYYSGISFGSGAGWSFNVSLHRVTSSWTETGATWNNMANNYASSAEATILVNPSSQYQLFSWSVLTLVQNWYNGTYNNYGLMLISNEQNATYCHTFYSRNNTSYQPYLSVTYNAKVDISALIPPLYWASSLVFSHDPNSRQFDTYYWSDQPVYVNWAIKEISGFNISTPFIVKLYRDNQEIGSWQIDGLYGYQEYRKEGIVCPPLPAGSHTFKLIADVNNVVYEISELNNTKEETRT